MAKTERIAFKMHANLLKHVFRSQAGTLAKAVAEGAMNAVDAKATGLQISISSSQVYIVDNGQGFRNRQEIEDWFAQQLPQQLHFAGGFLPAQHHEAAQGPPDQGHVACHGHCRVAAQRIGRSHQNLRGLPCSQADSHQKDQA